MVCVPAGVARPDELARLAAAAPPLTATPRRHGSSRARGPPSGHQRSAAPGRRHRCSTRRPRWRSPRRIPPHHARLDGTARPTASAAPRRRRTRPAGRYARACLTLGRQGGRRFVRAQHVVWACSSAWPGAHRHASLHLGASGATLQGCLGGRLQGNADNLLVAAHVDVLVVVFALLSLGKASRKHREHSGHEEHLGHRTHLGHSMQCANARQAPCRPDHTSNTGMPLLGQLPVALALTLTRVPGRQRMARHVEQLQSLLSSLPLDAETQRQAVSGHLAMHVAPPSPPATPPPAARVAAPGAHFTDS
eukprot:366343-Chlamydomonas_euryale.AAC.14